MNEPSFFQSSLGKVSFIVIFLIYIAFRLAPLDLTARHHWPELVLIFAIALTLRHSYAVPIWLLLLVGLFQDVVMQAPLGLGALLVIVAAQYTHRRQSAIRANMFWNEWAFVAMIILATAFLGELLKVIFFTPRQDFGALFIGTIINIAAYPAVVGLINLCEWLGLFAKPHAISKASIS